MQRNFWAEKHLKKGEYLVYHDESETEPNKGWLLIGLLFVKQSDCDRVQQALAWCRQQENYFGEVHFCKLPRSFGGEFGGKARVASRWLKSYEEGLFEFANFSCLAVNRRSPRFDHKRFSQEYHAYNRFTAMAIKAGISWFLEPKGFQQVAFMLVTDGKNRKSRPDQGYVDNFEGYIPYRVSLDAGVSQLNKKPAYPSVSIDSVQSIASHESDLLQLTDLLLGAFQSAIVNSSGKPTKRHPAQKVAAWYQDLQEPPWKQVYKMHRKFAVWGFPDEQGKAFNHFSLQVFSDAQPSLFDLYLLA